MSAIGHHDKAPTGQSARWMMTLGDLLAILLAMFIMIYAMNDHQSVGVGRAVISLADSLGNASGQGNVQTDPSLSGPYGYQIALLERHLEGAPHWSLKTDPSSFVSLELRRRALTDAFGDELWLESLERFDRPIWLTITVPKAAQMRLAASWADALKARRVALGLSQVWGVEIRQDPALDAPVSHITVPLEDSFVGYRRVAKELAVAP